MTTLVQAEDKQHPLTEANTVPDAIRADSSGAPPIADPENVTIQDIGDGILRIILRPGGQITEADGGLVRERFLALTGGAGAAVLLQIEGVGSVSRGAVRFFSEAATTTAFAILGSSPVDRVIAHGLHGLPLPQCPSRYFTDQQKALAWLGTHPELRIGVGALGLHS